MTLDFPIRPEIGARIGVYARLIRRFERRAACRHRRFRLPERRGRVVPVLLADRVDRDESVEALGAQARGGEIRLRHRERGLGLLDRGAVGRGVDPVQEVPGADVRPFLEPPLPEEAVDLGRISATR